MAIQWLRRALLAAVGATALLLASCGGGTIASQLSPERIVVFGDGFGDVGQNGRSYTVNNDAINVWTQFVASAYGLALTPSSRGGLGYATGNARVQRKPDAAGSNATPTVKQQVDAFLAASRPGGDDLILFSAGTSDVIAEVQAVLTGAQTDAQMIANLEQAGRDLAAQIKRLVNAGAEHVVVAGPYNMERSPWAIQLNKQDLMKEASAAFNQQLLIALDGQGANVLYVDAPAIFNAYTGDERYEFEDIEQPVCTSVDSGPGIGTGANQVNSNLCTPATVRAGADPALFLFADRVYPTARGHQLLGEDAYDRIRDRW